jgi:hypothetical protein
MTIGLLESLIINRAAKFLRGPNWGRFLKSYAATLDGVNEALREGMTASNPLVCAREDLPPIAKDRNLRIPPAMPDDGVRDMLATWLQLHRGRASAEGVLRHVRNYFAPGPYPSIQMVHENGTTASWHKVDSAGRYTLTKVPSNWDYDGLHQWGKWYLIIEDEDDDGTPIPALLNPYTWDGGYKWDEGAVWDGFARQTGTDLAAMAIDWKRAGTRLQALIVNRQPGSVGPSTSLVTDASGWTTLPTGGNWVKMTYPSSGGAYFGHNTRPPYLDWVYDRQYL